ncbi:hypothetical protein BDZ97DRAFT_1912436 [Flammula alnicola]|nr:hypothetical protein BDZ97DRAFT_1912436 [Flammula alnicola]
MDGYYPAADYNYGNYNDLAVAIPESLNIYSDPVAYTAHMVDHVQRQNMDAPSLQLHTPIPLPGQNPPLLGYSVLPMVDSMESHCHQPMELPVEICGDQELDPISLTLSEPQDSPINPEYCRRQMQHPTFPTPSELLAELDAKGLPVTADEFGSDVRSESASKARRRAMAKRVGFIPTDPDTISSHEKKRHYLESLEQYILYLHEQFALVGKMHAPLERVPDYRGLSSRSIRTVLVHMEKTTRRLNLRTLGEEQRFVNLRDEIILREHYSQ